MEKPDEKQFLTELLQIEREIRDRESVGHPGNYGMPDLLFPMGYHQGRYDPDGTALISALTDKALCEDGWIREPLEKEETEEQYHERQKAAIDSFISTNLFIIKDARKVYVKTIPILLDWVADIFYRRVSRSITWKPRGGGGSLTAAVLIWLLAIYQKRSVVDLAGSSEQSKIVYTYVTQFWDCIVGLKERLLDGPPLVSITRLRTGVELKCIPATEKQARGKHYSTIFIDEVCQGDARVERAMQAAVQGALSEEDPIVCLFSTFHIPQGLFQEYWDGSEIKGFTRYHWNVFHTMRRCELGMEHATDDDPLALEHCKNCFLTEKKSVKDMSGEYSVDTWTGCYGAARTSEGWATYEQIVEAKRTNIGTTVFECEFACQRPSYSSCVYSPEDIDASLIEPVLIDPNVDKVAVGIDWGIQTAGSLAITLGVRKLEYVYLSEIIYADHMLVSDVSNWLSKWQQKYGKFPILADSSHPFNNAELSQAGYDVRPVSFGTWKKIGIENVSKYFVFKRLRINSLLTDLINQLKNYRRNQTSGAIVKKGDHGPDSTMCLLLNFRFEDEFGPDLARAAAFDEQTRMLQVKKVDGVDRRAFDGSVIDQSAVRTCLPHFISEADYLKKSDGNVLTF